MAQLPSPEQSLLFQSMHSAKPPVHLYAGGISDVRYKSLQLERGGRIESSLLANPDIVHFSADRMALKIIHAQFFNRLKTAARAVELKDAAFSAGGTIHGRNSQYTVDLPVLLGEVRLRMR